MISWSSSYRTPRTNCTSMPRTSTFSSVASSHFAILTTASAPMPNGQSPSRRRTMLPLFPPASPPGAVNPSLNLPPGSVFRDTRSCLRSPRTASCPPGCSAEPRPPTGWRPDGNGLAFKRQEQANVAIHPCRCRRLRDAQRALRRSEDASGPRSSPALRMV